MIKKEAIAYIRKQRKSGATWQELGLKLGMSTTGVYLWARRNMGKDVARSAEKKINRLQAIAKLRSEGLTWETIGAKFGITRQATMQLAQHHMPELFYKKVLGNDQSKRLARTIELYGAKD